MTTNMSYETPSSMSATGISRQAPGVATTKRTTRMKHSRNWAVPSPVSCDGTFSTTVCRTRPFSVLTTMPSTASLIAVRVFQIVATCTTFSLVVHRGGWRRHGYGNFCMFIWCVCFSSSVIIMVLDLTELNKRLHVSWRDLTISIAMTATIGTAAASIMYPVYFLSGYSCPGIAQRSSCDEVRGYRIGATITSILATAAYAVEVSLSKARQGEISGLMATVSGLMKVVQVFVACVMFAVANERNVYNSWSAKEACLAIICICFILSFFAIIFSIIGWPCNPNFPIRRILAVYALLAFLAYIAVAIVWPVYSFDKTYGRPSRTCKGQPWGSCAYDDNVTITIAIYVNLIAYAVDLFYMHSYLRMTTT